MKFTRRISIFMSILLCLIMFLSTISSVFAATASELHNQQNSLDKQISEAKENLKDVQSDLSSNLKQITSLNAQISSAEDEISELEDKISELNTQITEKISNIEEQEKKYAEQKELLDKRLVALYESGSTSYLDMLLSANGLADFISKYYTIEILADADEQLLEKIDNTKKAIQSEKDSLEVAKEEVETNKTTVVGKKNQLATSKNQKQVIVNQLSDEEKEIQEQLEEFEREKAAVAAELAALAKKNNYTVVSLSAAGYGTPLAGRTKANITCGYMGYAGHTGADFACPSGTPVLAVKAGTVVISKACFKNGKYVSYGEYIAIDHHDGTVTLYAHMSSRAVGVGANVSQGQQIGSSGSTGRSTGPHLHFEVRVNGKHVNPAPYLP